MNQRKRREYLLRKENEEKERVIKLNKQIVKGCIEEDSKLPFELRDKGYDILKEIFHETNEEEDAIDKLPFKIFPIITTSRDPSDKCKQFSRRLAHMLGTTTISRGNLKIDEITEYMNKSNFNALIMVSENRGVPTSLSFTLYPYGPTYYFGLYNIKMSEFKIKGDVFYINDIEKITEASVETLDKKTTKYNQEEKPRDRNKVYNDVGNLFSRLFSIKESKCEKIQFKRTVYLGKKEEILFLRHYQDDVSEGFDMKLYEVVRGTLEGGETEWILKPFINTHRKQE